MEKVDELLQDLSSKYFADWEIDKYQPAFTCSKSKMETLKNVWNPFKVKNNDTRTTSLMSFFVNVDQISLIYQVFLSNFLKQVFPLFPCSSILPGIKLVLIWSGLESHRSLVKFLLWKRVTWSSNYEENDYVLVWSIRLYQLPVNLFKISHARRVFLNHYFRHC